MGRGPALRVPRYAQIADALRYRLARAGQVPNTRLAAESVLAAEFGVSRETVREALTLLRAEGLVYSVTGRGTFASPSQKPVGVRITQPIHEPHVAGRPSKPVILSRGLVRATSHVCAAFGTRPRSRVYRFEILRTIKGQPFRICHIYLPDDVARSLDLDGPLRLTVSEKIEREGRMRLIRAQQEIVAIGAPPEAAARLGLRTGAPVLRFRRTYFLDTGRAVEYSEEYQDSGRFPYEETMLQTPRHSAGGPAPQSKKGAA